MAVYLDCNATTPLDPEVRHVLVEYLTHEYGNEGSWTHDFGRRARLSVDNARRQLADLAAAKPEEVIFTCGATESNNLALLGLAEFGERRKRRHIIASTIEHKAVLGPLSVLERRGFETTYLRPDSDGRIRVEELRQALREDTLLVSVMHVNNETGVIQPLDSVAELLENHQAYLHVDAAQGFGKELSLLKAQRIDLISVSGHKMYAPQGIGALIARKRAGIIPPPLQPIMFGGGQQRGLRPGTLPVPLIIGLGMTASLAARDHLQRDARCRAIKDEALAALAPLNPIIHGDPDKSLPTTLYVSFPQLDADRVLSKLGDLIAASNGSACSSENYVPSRVLLAMGVPEDVIRGAIRLSWCHMTEAVDWAQVAERVARLYREPE